MPFGIEVFYYKWPKEISWLETRFFFFFFKNIYLFICRWLCWVFTAAHGFLYLQLIIGPLSSCDAGFSLQWPLFLGSTGSGHTGFRSCSPQILEQGSGTGAQAQLFPCTRDLPGPGIEPEPSALSDKFLTSGPSGNPRTLFIAVVCKLWGHGVDGHGGKKQSWPCRVKP